MDFFDIHQERRLNENLRDIQQTSNRTAAAHREIETLRADVDRLHLATAAVWEIVRERLGVDEAELLEKIREIDLRDGALDGRVRTTARACEDCGRPNNGRRAACLYCGQELPPRAPLG